MSDHGHETHHGDSHDHGADHGHDQGHGHGGGKTEFKATYLLGIPLLWEFINGTIGSPAEVHALVNKGAEMPVNFTFQTVKGGAEIISQGFTNMGADPVSSGHTHAHGGGAHH